MYIRQTYRRSFVFLYEVGKVGDKVFEASTAGADHGSRSIDLGTQGQHGVGELATDGAVELATFVHLLALGGIQSLQVRVQAA